MSDPDDRDDSEGQFKDEYKVGYGRPPTHTRFKPGRSGNPRGRPRGQRNFASEIARVLALPVHITLNGKRKRVNTITALALRLREQALSGDHKARQLLISLHQSHVGEAGSQASLHCLLAEDAEILREAGLLKDEGHGDERE